MGFVKAVNFCLRVFENCWKGYDSLLSIIVEDGAKSIYNAFYCTVYSALLQYRALLLYSVQCPFTVQCTVTFYSTVYSDLLQYRALFWLDSELLQGVALAAAPPVETIKFVNWWFWSNALCLVY